MSRDVLIIGGGLAGLACASALAPLGERVTLVESRNRLGGRAGSFTDPQSGQLVDACQHVSMGCCTNLDHFLRTVGVAHWLEAQPVLYFMTPDRRVSRFRADPWPAPFHLGRALASSHYLTAGDKLRIGWGMLALVRANPDDDVPFLDWLRRQHQSERAIERFWAIVLTSALNETIDRVGLRYARKVFVDGFLRHRRGFEVHVPSVPLGRLYGEEMQRWLMAHGATIELNRGVKQLHHDGERIHTVEFRDGSRRSPDVVVLAVSFERAADLLPELSLGRGLQASPITSVHLWYDRSVMRLPHVVLIGCQGQWVFQRGEVTPGEWYVQVVVSASRELRELGRDAIEQRIAEEMKTLFPAARTATLKRSKVVTEHAATFSAVPGVDDSRPTQTTGLRNLYLAGDWTRTGWPATMEGAVRSGYLAAQAITGRRDLLQPDLR